VPFIKYSQNNKKVEISGPCSTNTYVCDGKRKEKPVRINIRTWEILKGNLRKWDKLARIGFIWLGRVTGGWPLWTS
jgi:hypothetical protein